MKKFITSLFVISLVLSPLASSDNVFDEFDAEMNEFESPDNDKIVKEYISFVSGYLAEYDTWRKEYLNGFDYKQTQIIMQWGETTAQDINNVVYSEDLKTRELVDYDNNQAVIEILVPVDTTAAESEKILTSYLAKDEKKSEAKQALKKVVKAKDIQLNEIKFDAEQEKNAKEVIKKQTIAYKNEADLKADKLQETQASVPESIIEKSVELQKKTLEKEEAQRIAVVEAQYAALREKTKVTPPTYKVLKYTAKLPANSLSKRAKKYKPFAEKESQRFDIPVALVMAIMHSESAFQPKAKSAVPAYGLMQIVPRTAGHDVNKMIRKIDKPMQVKELYVPSINVETGSAYLSILDKRYLKSITDPKSRLYCTIAAYNTGAGNVAKVFNSSGNTRNINKAARVINTLSPEQVYTALMNKLPYDETKHYLKKVSKRIALYETKSAI
ncbi:transglycosylase SLT domain-containing protein [Psychromonas arctica]|uniref:transglycosylase SLT domain-containing protein n=1 Tax=Psychromonas arctica TaxID=168275 RepID=UPI0004123214|nr:transglycosylase SLT domain-containing protein [Psychromonas arctica]